MKTYLFIYTNLFLNVSICHEQNQQKKHKQRVTYKEANGKKGKCNKFIRLIL